MHFKGLYFMLLGKRHPWKNDFSPWKVIDFSQKIMNHDCFIIGWNTEKRVENMKCSGVFDEFRGVSSDDETLCQVLDITSQTKWF